jgi:hypothetical protein
MARPKRLQDLAVLDDRWPVMSACLIWRPRFTCQACGTKRAGVRPNFDWEDAGSSRPAKAIRRIALTQGFKDQTRKANGRSFSVPPERFHHPRHRRVFAVLDLHPMLGPASLIEPVAALRHQASHCPGACGCALACGEGSNGTGLRIRKGF